MTEAMLFLQKTILLSYDPRPLFRGGLFAVVPLRLGFVPPPRRWEQGRTTRPVEGLPTSSPAAPAFSFAFCPHPPNPLPRRGRGRPKVYFAGGFAPGTPTLNRPRHLQTLPSRHPAGHRQRRVEPVPRPSQPRGCKGRSPLHKKTKSLPLPRRGRALCERGRGDGGSKSS